MLLNIYLSIYLFDSVKQQMFLFMIFSLCLNQ